MRRLSFMFTFVCIFSFCRSELNLEEKESLLNGFIQYLNNLPNHEYVFKDGILLSAQEADDNYHTIQVKLKEGDTEKYSRCTCTLKLQENGVLIKDDVYSCEGYKEVVTASTPESTPEGTPESTLEGTDSGNPASAVGDPAPALGDLEASEGVSENQAAHKPVELDNEIRPNTETTSGEQFVAIPREEPIRRNSAACIGCGSRVDTAAPGVDDLALVGIKQLDRQEPHIKHSLNKVVEVERQVQVVNGVRYILTLLVDINNCTSSEDSLCSHTIPCKVSILEKPWIKFPNGAKYRAILSNNCTEQWLFGDNGDVVSDADDNMDDSVKPTPDYDKMANSGSADDILKAIHNKDLQSQQTQKGLNEQEIKNLEEQIIPYNQFHTSSDPFIFVTESSDHADVSKYNPEVETVKHYSDNSNTNNQEAAFSPLPEDKKKAIDDLMNFFDFAGYTTKDKRQTSRRKRSYKNDIKVMSLVNDYKKVKESLNNAKFIYGVAQVMVDYLNEVYFEKMNRTLKEVIAAEEEVDNGHRFIYLQARVVKLHKDVTKNKLKICNGVLDVTNIDDPKVISAFCFDDGTNKSNFNVPVPVPADDNVLKNLMNTVLKKMESESPNANAIKLSKIISASTQQGSGTLTKVSAIFVFLNCSKNTPFTERHYCVEIEEFGSKICEIEIFQRAWLKATEITQNCIETQIDETFSDEKKIASQNNINDKKVIEMVEQALSYLESQSNRNNRQKVLDIKSVLTQRVAGVLTSVDFVVGYTDCKNGIDVDIRNCNILRNETRYCTVKVWQRPWLKDGNEMKVLCNDNYTDTNYLTPINHTKNNIPKINPEDEYFDNAMAKLSLEKYLQKSGITQSYEVASVDSVKVRIGEVTTSYIDFTIRSLDNKKKSDLVKCHSLIQFRASFDDKNITVDCEFDDQISERVGIGGPVEKDPNSPTYKALAEESMHHYLQTGGVNDEHEVISVDKVTHQLVSGSLTKLEFTIKPVSEGDAIKCHSEVFEQAWMNKKEIKVNCNTNGSKLRKKRQVPGGLTEKDPNDPIYKALAEESMQKYLSSIGNTQNHKVISVDKVSTQVVSGYKTMIDFTLKPVGDGDVIKCHSEVWERPWLNEKDIKVDCNIQDQKLRTKRGLPGGETLQDPNDPIYKALAKESMQKYLTSVGVTQSHKVISVDEVTTQVVAGSLTRLKFTIKPVGDGDVIKCHSEVWERPWLNEKDIKVDCNIQDQKLRSKRGFVGGQKEKDPNDPIYKALAEESMQKYLTSVGETQSHKVISVDEVTTQVVAGSLTRLKFTIKPVGDGDVIKCHSEVWERPWLNEKDIKVDCNIQDQKLRSKRGFVGGQNEKDPNDPIYKALAEESMQKYLTSVGETQSHKVISVDEVTTQVVAGSLTRLKFTIKPVGDGDVIKCHSEVWERPWLNEKDIKVDCNIQDQKLRTKRGLPGGETLQDPNDPIYKALAEESMQKYLTSVGETQSHKVISVDKVTTQVVSGSKTRIDFTIKPVGDGDVIKCHSEVWGRPWVNEKDIKVDCNITDHKIRKTRRISEGASEMNPCYPKNKAEKAFENVEEYRSKAAPIRINKHKGGLVEQNPTNPEFLALAKDSLQKYKNIRKSQSEHVVLEVKKVTTQVVAGIMYRINFIAKRISCASSDVKRSLCNEANENKFLFCFSKVWNRPWLKQKKIDVSCYNEEILEDDDEINNHTQTIKKFKLGVKEKKDANNVEYEDLATLALKKYMKEKNFKYGYKVNKIYHVTEQVTAGVTTNIDFAALPDNCFEGKCPEKFQLHCQSEIFERPGESSVKEIISIICKRKRNKASSIKSNRALRGKRNVDIDDNDVEEELKYYYADLAVTKLNNRLDADNVYKLVSIHALQSTTQMKNTIVLMYLEVALTYCLKQEHNDLTDCDEMEGLQHRLCYARLYPTSDDELIVKHVSVVCDNDDNFEELTGLSIPYLLRASIKYIEDDPNISNKIINVGPPYVIPSLDSRVPFKINLMVTTTNCSKTVDVLRYNGEVCLIDHTITPKTCNAYIFMTPNTNLIKKMDVRCYKPELMRSKRSVSLEGNSSTSDASEIRKLAELAVQKLEMESLHRYKQKILEINNYSVKLASRKQTYIDFEVGYTSCIKHEWVDDVANCELLGHLPRRLCHAVISETLWNDNGMRINVNCTDDETPLEAHVEFNNVQTAELLANEALRHIEAKYPHPRKQKVARIFSLEKQSVAGLHYRLKMEVGLTNCSALSSQENCQITSDAGANKFCRVNVWIRPWVQHSALYRVTCDYQNDLYTSMYEVVQAQHLFFEFVQTYKPDYMDNEIEMQKRFKIFRDNVKKIHELNVHELGTAMYGVTRFADLTYEEFSAKHLGLNVTLKNENNIPWSQAQIPKLDSVPGAFDWREHGAVTEVKDQGSCGSCWAFSVTGNIEGQWKLKKGELVSLSEQELVDCDKLDDGCNGGLPDNAYRAIEQLGGLEQENDYPYEGEDDKCSFNKTMAKVQISGAVNITSNETDMAKWLVKNGPISIGINANAMQFYMGGVSHPWKMLCSPKNLDHGVLIVGYGIKEYPLFNKKLPYWTIKNSWGPSWGEQGYYRVYRGDGTCGVNQMASSAIV